MIDLVQKTMSNQKLNKPFHSYVIVFPCMFRKHLMKVFICTYMYIEICVYMLHAIRGRVRSMDWSHIYGYSSIHFTRGIFSSMDEGQQLFFPINSAPDSQQPDCLLSSPHYSQQPSQLCYSLSSPIFNNPAVFFPLQWHSQQPGCLLSSPLHSQQPTYPLSSPIT